jgi:hypothetical protein
MGTKTPALPPRATWTSLPGKPTTFAPSAHTHPWNDITDKPSVYPPAPHTHSYNDLTDKPVIPTLPALVLKDVKSRLATNTTGFWTRTYPAGFWTGEPSINVTPISASAGTGQITLRTAKTLTAGAWKVDVQFTMLPATISILVLGTVTLGTSPGTVLFDYSAAEPNAA